MKTLYAVLVASLVLLVAMPTVFANDVGVGINIDFETEEFKPKLWMCDHRKVIDDEVEKGRIKHSDPVFSAKIEQCEFAVESCYTACFQGAASWCYSFNGGPEECIQFSHPLDCLTFCQEYTIKWDCPIKKGFELVERVENYAFEGEKIEWIVLVMDKNKIEQVTDVVATIGSMQGEGNDVEVECVRLNGYVAPGQRLDDSCNARILEEELTQFDDQTMAFYECTLTVETPESFYGEYWVTVEACDATDKCDTMDENEFWFFNPIIALNIDGLVTFGDEHHGVRPGTISYSDTILVENDADIGSGVLLDMFISGTDFYDPSSSGARCVITNRLKLGNNHPASGLKSNDNECKIGFGDTDDHLCYFASNGAYSTETDPRADAEGYVPIVYGDNFDTDFYNDAEVMQPIGPYFPGFQPGNILSPGAEIAVTFKLGLPEPCVGDFTDGDIFFWGEAI